MKIACLVKVVPEVDKFKFDFTTNTVIRENIKMIINPEDGCAVGFGLEVKQSRPETIVETITMGPKSVLPLIEDFIRRGVDQATLISDPALSGSDSYVTALVLARYLQKGDYDLILSGSQSLDGDTGHVPAQVGEWLDLFHASYVLSIEKEALFDRKAIFEMEQEATITKYRIPLPAILGVCRASNYNMPYIGYDAINEVVTHQIKIQTAKDLGFLEKEVGVQGSLTQVKRAFVKSYQARAGRVVQADEQGIDEVYQLLKDKGFLE